MSSSSLFLAEAAEDPHHTYNRKQKSLGLLCSKFVEIYNREDVVLVVVDEAAKNLGVERRRIYDIVNVLESIGVLARKAKNQYTWIGFSGIPRALENIKEKALKETPVTPGNIVEALPSQYTRSYQEDHEGKEEYKRSLDQSKDYAEERCSSLSIFSYRIERRREKSLAMLTENFVKLFLTKDVDTVTLDEAAKLLIDDHHETSESKTKARRLYDITNVLSSLNLIEKTHHVDTRKPAFRWLGLNGRQIQRTVTVGIPSVMNNTNNSNKRLFGMDISNMDMSKRKRSAATANKKSVQTETNIEEVKTCNLIAHKQLQSERYCFGPFTPLVASKREKNCEEKRERVSQIDVAEDLPTDFFPEYHNQALHGLFDHYVGAWKKWYALK